MQRTCGRIGRLGFLVGVLLAVGLAGCPGPKDTNNAGPSGNTGGSGNTTGGGKTIHATVVVDTGGKDDKSFNQAADAGLQRAIKELGVEGTTIESKEAADYKTNLTNAATTNSDIVFAIGTNMESALQEVAPQFSSIKFAIVDGNAPAGASNCASLKFKEQEATFLAGFLAASMSKTKTIGFVGGMQIPLIQKFEAGYRAGAKTAGFDPDKQVKAAYTGNWDDMLAGRSQADQEFNNGADIIFQAAGKAGLGVIEAARDKGAGFYAIGVDQDQDYIAPGRVLTSVLKRVDTAVYNTIKDTKEGHFTPGEHVFGLKEGAVGLSEMKYTSKDVPADVQAKLNKLTDMVASGQVIPPTKLEEVASFQPPKL